MADISKITLPSGNTYDIKDATARSMIAGGITFKIVWTATDYASSSAPSAAKKAEIPVDYTIYYNHGASFTKGTLVASETTKGTFYLIYSKTTAGSLDVYEEVVTVEDDRTTPHTFFWEKIGDTQIDLSNVVTDVTLNKVTDVALTLASLIKQAKLRAYIKLYNLYSSLLKYFFNDSGVRYALVTRIPS